MVRLCVNRSDPATCSRSMREAKSSMVPRFETFRSHCLLGRWAPALASPSPSAADMQTAEQRSSKQIIQMAVMSFSKKYGE